MINVSDKFKAGLAAGRKVYEEIEITYGDTDRTTEILDGQIMQGDNQIVDGAGSSSFPIGATIEKYMTVCLDNTQEQYSDKYFAGALLIPYIKMTFDDGTVERVKKGEYTVISPESYGEIIQITAVDRMYKADQTYTTSQLLPASLFSLVKDACDKCDIPMGFSSMMHGSLNITSLPSSMTFRAFLGYAALIEGANARIDNNGYLQFMQWDFDSLKTSGKHHELKDFLSAPDVSATDIKITGIRVTGSGNGNEYLYGTDDYVIELNNPLVTADAESVAKWIGEKYIGKTIRRMSGSIPADPTIEFGDMAYSYKFVPSTGETRQYVTPITDVTFKLHGETSVETQTEDALRESATYTSPYDAAISQASRLVEEEKSARKNALKELADSLGASSGLYMTKELQEDGSTIYYMHNMATLEESDIVWKLTAEAFAISTDGGETYPYGFAVTGELITRLLYAKGIDADYITSGTITVADPITGEITFKADMATGQVDIAANTFNIGGETVREVANSEARQVLFSSHENLIKGYKFSEDDLSTYWATAGDIETGIEDPDGGTNAIKITGTSDDCFVSANESTNKVIYTSDITYEVSVWLKADTAFTAKISFNRTFYDVSVTTEWQKYSYWLSVSDINSGQLFTIGGYSSIATGDVLYAYDPTVTISYTQEEIFNALTNNGALEGLYMKDGKLYISADYIGTGTLAADRIAAKSVSAAKLNVSDLYAIGATIGGFKIGSTYLSSTDAGAGNDSSAVKRLLLASYNNNNNHNAFTVQSRDTTSDSWKNLFQLNYDGTLKAQRVVLGNSPRSNGVPDYSYYNIGESAKADRIMISEYVDINYNHADFNMAYSTGTWEVVANQATNGTALKSYSYRLCRQSSSSKRYKDISRELTDEDIETFFDMPLYMARYKEGYLSEEDERYMVNYPMFIAEEIDAIMPEAVNHLPDGRAETWNYRVMIPVMFQMIKSLKNEITELKSEIEELKRRE